MFRTPVEALRRADGSVQCGECSSLFVALKHALLLDSPIVEHISPQNVHISHRRSWTSLIFVGVLLVLGALGVAASHVGLQRNAFSLDYVYAVAPAYKVAGVQMPLYKGIDSFVLGQSSLLKVEDNSIRLSFTLYNRAGVPVEWPQLRVVLLGAAGQTTYDVVTNVEDLLSTKPTGPFGPQSDVVLEAHISAEKAKDAVTYKLEVVER